MRTMPLLSLAAVLLVAACSSGHDDEGGQVFAVIDGKEVTAPMLDATLARLPPGANRKDPQVQKAALDQLVSETLLARQAEETKLDRDPAVRRAVEAAGRAVLAQSFLERGLSTAAPTDTEVVQFFSDHPYLFSDRRRYDLDTIQVRGTPESVRPYVAALGSGGMTIGALAERMARDHVAVVVDHDRLTGDQMPDRVAMKLAASKPGDVFTYRSGDVQRFVQLMASEASPVPLALARPTISLFLQNQRRQTQMAASLKRLREDTKVEYRGVGKAIMATRDTPPVARTTT